MGFPFLGVHEEAVLDGGVVCGEVFEEEDGGADVGGVGGGEELEVGVVACGGSCAVLLAFLLGVGGRSWEDDASVEER